MKGCMCDGDLELDQGPGGLYFFLSRLHSLIYFLSISKYLVNRSKSVASKLKILRKATPDAKWRHLLDQWHIIATIKKECYKGWVFKYYSKSLSLFNDKINQT